MIDVKTVKILSALPLFFGMDEENIRAALACIAAAPKRYVKGAVLLREGDAVTRMGILTEGAVRIIKTDAEGRSDIIGMIEAPGLFAEVFLLAGLRESPVRVEAAAESGVLWAEFPDERLLCKKEQTCGLCRRLTHNMVRMVAGKNLELQNKIACISRRTLREKVWAFLGIWRQKLGTNPFTVPFSRAEMADYLSADRTALSAVLSELKAEGKIDFQKSTFKIISGAGSL